MPFNETPPIIFLKRWTASRFVQWDDTISLHVRLFRCFLSGLLDAHRELTWLSQGSERMLAVLGQRLANAGLMHEAGHPHEPISRRVSPLGTMMWCPPKRRYEATPLPSFAVNSPTDPTVPVFLPSVSPHSVSITHGLYDKTTPPAVAFDLTGPERILGGYDGPSAGVVGFILLWVLALAVVMSRCSSSTFSSAPVMCQPPRVAVKSTSNSQVVQPLPPSHLPNDESARCLVADAPEDIDINHQASMPGAWLHDRQGILETLEESIFDMSPWMLFCSFAQAWAHFPGLTSIFAALDAWEGDSSNVDIIRRKSDDGCSLVCRGHDAGVSIPAALNGTEQQCITQDRLLLESGLSIESLSTTGMRGRSCDPGDGDVAIKDSDSAWTTALDIVYGDEIGSTFAFAASSKADRALRQEDTSSEVDPSVSEDESDGCKDGGVFDVGTRISSLEGNDECRVLGLRQDIFDVDDEGISSDSYWMEQVNARLSGEQNSRRTQCRHDCSDVSSCSGEGREDGTDNWRIRSSQVTRSATPEKTSDAVRCQADNNSTKRRRYSTPRLGVNASLSHRTSGEDGPQGIYVVPQKRGQSTGGQCSLVSIPRLSDRPSGLGFFPFRKTSSLLTPEAWRPGCLYIPDPPVDESRQAEVWRDSLSPVGSRRGTSGVGHGCSAGSMNQDVAEHEPPFSRDGQDAPVSWRDRYENDPASRRFVSAHRRATTEG